jgi:hypothetical protein
MIKYSLVCKKCDLTFESWFASSNEFEKLKKRKFLNCHNCGSLDVKKSLMAPSLINNKKNQNYEKDTKKLNKIKKTLKEYQKFIKNNFEYVGDNFAYEARSIHYNNKKKEKRIYGTASKKDLEDLREEGIETKMIPWIEDDKN